ncbi:hypothetical protein [Actinomyces succiniciruminis]|uniref:Uncharacterized protein n=1 Tax=Actinomyces succiniciruminis TaxID=1522002 RepID=A0A1L7RK71_9ACTO|nr:hypothetical protein [Actinomyces succiniciruminis]CED90460.1 Hypothetical protein AAM4_0565 [Actinomyces succiniciruminis]
MIEPQRIRRRPRRAVVVRAVLALLVGVVLGAVGPVSAAAAAESTTTPASPAARAVSAAVSTSPNESAPLVVLGVSGLSWTAVRELAAADDPLVAADAAAVLDYAAANEPVNLVQRTVGEASCPADGWLTLGAGTRARADASHLHATTTCSGGTWTSVARLAQADGYGAEPGRLATALEAAGVSYAAAGDGAVLALTNAAGPPDSADPAALLAGSGTGATGDRAADDGTAPGLILIDLMGAPDSGDTGPASAPTEPSRAAQAVRALAQALGELTGPARVVVVSVADPQDPSPQLAILPAGTTSTRGSDGGLLVGPSTHRRGLIQLTDLAPTLLAALAGRDAVAASGLSGGVLTLPTAPTAGAADPSASAAAPNSPASADRTAALADDAVHAVASEHAVIPVTLVLLAAALVLLVAVGLGLRRPRRGALGRLGWAACWVTALPAGIWLANLVPWWRAETWAPVVAALVGALGAGLLTGVAALLARMPRLGAPGAALALAATVPVVILADAAVGAPLGFNGPLGMNAVVAGRFYGVSNTAFALAAGALVVALAVGADRFAATRGHRRAAVVAAVAVPGLLVLAIDGAPQLGADVGGALTLIPALVALGAGLAGVRLGLRRWLGVGAVTVGVVGGFALVDYASGSRTHLGGFVAQVLDGTAGTTLARKAGALVSPFRSSPLALAALVVGLVLAVAVARWLPRTVRRARAGRGPYAWLTTTPAPAWLSPALRALAVLVVVEVLVNDSGPTMLLFSAAAALPALAALLLSGPGQASPTGAASARAR